MQRSPVRRSQRHQPEDSSASNKTKIATTTAKTDTSSSKTTSAKSNAPSGRPSVTQSSDTCVSNQPLNVPLHSIDMPGAPLSVPSISLNVSHSAPPNAYMDSCVIPVIMPSSVQPDMPPPSAPYRAPSSTPPSTAPPSMPPSSASVTNIFAAAKPKIASTPYTSANVLTSSPSQTHQVSEFAICNNAYVSVGPGTTTPLMVDLDKTAPSANVNAAPGASGNASASVIVDVINSADVNAAPCSSGNASASVIADIVNSADVNAASTSATANVGSAATASNLNRPAISTGVSMPTYDIAQMSIILAMQQQISNLELQLQKAQFKMTVAERECITCSSNLMPLATSPLHSSAVMQQHCVVTPSAQATITSHNVAVPSSNFVLSSSSNALPRNHEQPALTNALLPPSGQPVTVNVYTPANGQPAIVNPATPLNRQPVQGNSTVSFNGQSATHVTTNPHSCLAIPNGTLPQIFAAPHTVSQATPPTVSSSSTSCYGQPSWSPAILLNDVSAAASAPSATQAHNLAATMPSHTPSVNSMPPPRKLLDLPSFSGHAEDWPIFYAAFTESTSVYNYTNFENNQRLNKCLKGEARDVVKSLLIHPNNVNFIIEQLRFRFGRPEQLVRSQLKVVREVLPISEANIGRLVSFATITKNLTVFLQSIGEEKHLANPTLLEELVSKLPLNKRFDWARSSASIRPYPTISNFSDWLSEVASFAQMVQDSEPRESKRRAVLHTSGEQRSVKCIVCQNDHKVIECRRLLEATVSDRWKTVKRLRLCFSCLWPGHSTRDCRRRRVCPVKGCSRFHNRLLHECDGGQPVKASHAPESLSVNNPVLNCSARADVKLLFRVIPVTLYGPNKRVNTYALLDEGSAITMMDDSLIQELGLTARQRQVEIQWFGGKAVNESVAVVNLSVSGLGKKKRHMLRNVHGVANLNLPMQSLSREDIRNAVRYRGKMPVQPYENVTPKLLIGLDHCHLGLPIKSTSTSHNGPYAAFTDLGCVIFGPSISSPPRKPSCLHISTSESQVHDMIREYFSVESFGVRAAPPLKSPDDVRAEQILEKTTVKLDGRFQTGLLWKYESVEVPESYSMALRRLVGIERRMDRDKEFRIAYQNIIETYTEKNYARKLQPREAAERTPKTWYLPHFAVVNPQKPGKLRLVFDAAATSHGVSLNSQLLKGPQQYRSLVSVLFHLREGAVAVCADIQEMFHQVVIRPEDRCSQRFLWRNGDSQKPPDVYEMTAMTFGAACSPCSANYVKVRNALEHRNHDPRAVRAITEHHYVDDYVDSFSSASEAICISKQVRDIHKGASFQLRKFRSNIPEVTAALDGGTTALPIKSKENVAWEKVLGMMWLPQHDKFIYRPEFHGKCASVMNGDVVPTKRLLLSIIMSIFDPLGFLCHFTITAKVMMREIWMRDLGWDEPITDDIHAIWSHLRRQMANVSECQVPRHYFHKGKPESLQLHIFVDASEDAFGAVAYWRSETSSGDVDVSIIFAKTRSAPLKPLSVPRLELQAALLGSRMMTTIVGEHTVHVNQCVFWSDSRTVLKWIASEHCRYKPFVAHRIAEILGVSNPTDWRWVPTKENVADEATRVNKGINLSPSSRWFTGPAFLHQHESRWPTETTNGTFMEEDCEELRPKFALLVNTNFIIDFTRFSAYNKLKRVTAWVLRFVNNCKPTTQQANITLRYGLTASELDSAERLLCRQIQREVFADEINRLKEGTVLASSSLYTLMPYIDSHGLLRVSGRLTEASWLAYDAKHPIILPPKHTVTKLIVAYEHSRMMHLNTEATICMIRQRFWIPNLRKVLRGVITKCNICKIKRARPHVPQMGQLPKDRVTPYVRPFTYTGLDYFGPVNVAIGRRTEKRWVALFTCLSIRAIHLEIAHDLSTDSCILALRNFMNRRGVPRRIRSDNGKNFVGVDGELKRFRDVFDYHELQSELSTRSVEWVFNCPEDPSAGGAWERMVQCVKKVLRHTMKELSPKEHTFQSLLIEAENVVNSRPLTHLPVTPEQEEPLTPNHFLLGSANTAQTSSCLEPPKKYCSLRKQWHTARQMRDRFWKRWVEEYLPTLTRRSKWCSPTDPLKQGDLVFICDPHEPRKEWRRGRILRIYPGRDGQVRRADVQTSTGAVQRPASKLAKLDVVSGESGLIHVGGDVID